MFLFIFLLVIWFAFNLVVKGFLKKIVFNLVNETADMRYGNVIAVYVPM